MPTKIEWAEETWNPVTGCTPISEGCQNCYAKRMAQRLRGRFGYPSTGDPFRIAYHPDRFNQPLNWKKPRKIFVCSMGDLFHEDVEFHIIDDIMGTTQRANQHTYIVLTKRPWRLGLYIQQWAETLGRSPLEDRWKNIWLGVTAENQKRADERIPILLQIPAAKRFVSIEPMLEPVDLHMGDIQSDVVWRRIHGASSYGDRRQPDWVIVGGESGPGARHMDSDWARSVRDQCREAGVPFFMKQMSGTGADRQRIPVDLQIRDWPK